MPKLIRDSITVTNAQRLINGVQAGKSYAAIGRSYSPPITGSAAYKHALKVHVKTDAGEMVPLATLHPRHGSKRGPYSRNRA